MSAICLILPYCGRARARPQTNLAFGGQHILVGTFLAFLCFSNWNEWYVNKPRSKGPGVECKLRDMGHVFHVNISKCSFPTHMSWPAVTRPSNKIFIPFKERLLYGVIYPQKFKVCFGCSSLSFNLVLHHVTFEFYNSTLLNASQGVLGTKGTWRFTFREQGSCGVIIGNKGTIISWPRDKLF